MKYSHESGLIDMTTGNIVHMNWGGLLRVNLNATVKAVGAAKMNILAPFERWDDGRRVCSEICTESAKAPGPADTEAAVVGLAPSGMAYELTKGIKNL